MKVVEYKYIANIEGITASSDFYRSPLESNNNISLLSDATTTTNNNISIINNKIFSLFPSLPSNVPKKMKMSDGLGVTSVTIVTSPSVVTPTTMNCLNSASVTTLPNISTTTNNHINSSNSPCANNHVSTQNLADYLAQLIKDKKQLAIFPNLFIHVERILDEGKQKQKKNNSTVPFTQIEKT